MDFFLTKVTQQAMNYAIRSGIAITSGYAISQCSRLLKTQDGEEKEELQILQRRLESKIRIISPAIDMIELITARGNTSLESAVSLTKSLRWDIQALGVQLANAATNEELARRRSSKAKTRAQRDAELRLVISNMRKLLEGIEDAVPLINLAITTSGASTFLSAGDAHFNSDPSKAAQIGPTFTLSMYMLFSGYAYRPQDEEGLRNTTWKEVIHKARVKLLRTSIAKLDTFPFTNSNFEESPGTGGYPRSDEETFSRTIPATATSDEFAYQLMFVEDLDDGRVHTFEDDNLKPGSFDDVENAGIREILPVHQVSKIFYADTGKILNIGNNDETNNPVLLLKRDVNASPPRRMMENRQEETKWDSENDSEPADKADDHTADEASELAAQFERETSIPANSSFEDPWRLPPGLDPEWIALEVYTEDPDSDTESEGEADDIVDSNARSDRQSRQASLDPNITSALSKLRLESSPTVRPALNHDLVQTPQRISSSSPRALSAPLFTASGVRTSLSLLEMLIRLTSLQQFQQASHLTITDELLNFFLEESSTTGAAPGDVEERKRIRMEARQRVGFDPYNESPTKRRGEQYQDPEGATYSQGYRNEWDHVSSPLSAQDHGQNGSSVSPLLLRSREHSLKSGSSNRQETPRSTR